jgi:hypothetical protein
LFEPPAALPGANLLKRLPNIFVQLFKSWPPEEKLKKIILRWFLIYHHASRFQVYQYFHTPEVFSVRPFF